MNKEQLMAKMDAKREAAIREIFSVHGAAIMLKLMKGVDLIVEKAFEGNADMEAVAESIADVVSSMSPQEFNAMRAEMQEVDEGHTKSRIVRMVDAIMEGAIMVLEHDWDNMPEERKMTLARTAMTKEQSDQLTKLENAKKRAERAKADYENLVKTMGKHHPYSMEALHYLGEQLKQFESEMAMMKKIAPELN